MPSHLSAWLQDFDVGPVASQRQAELEARRADGGGTLSYDLHDPVLDGPEFGIAGFRCPILNAPTRQHARSAWAEPSAETTEDTEAATTLSCQWFFDGCLESLRVMGVPDATPAQTAELLIRTRQLLISGRADDELQSELLDIFGFNRLEFIGEMLAGRAALSVLSVPNKPQKLLKMLEKSRQRREPDCDDGQEGAAVSVQQLARGQAGTLLPRGSTGGGGGGGFSDGLHLPPGTVQQDHKRYEEWLLPPTKSCPAAKPDELIEIAAAMPAWAGSALLPIKKLNRLQSMCFTSAFHSSENLLVCAPTGSGKTNVAILSVLRALGLHTEHMDVQKTNVKWSADDLAGLKIVYLAPLKALAAEVAKKFGKTLGPLGVKVRELTGDTSLTRAAINETQILVATPEKWDVITRKTADVGIATQVRLLIIDEVHLLHEDRGAVLEALVARTLRMASTTQNSIRVVALSATLPNYKDVAAFLQVHPDRGLFFFDAAYRPVPLSQEFIGVKEKDRWKQKQLMNDIAWKKVHRSVTDGHQCLIFVHARNETVRTGQALLELAREAGIDLCAREECPDWDTVSRQVSKSPNAEMKELFYGGFGVHHAGMLRPDRLLMERLFERGLIKVLVATATLSWGVNLPAHTVVIKGTQIYSAEKGGFVEMSMQDVLQCFGRAGRPQFDTSGEGIIITTHDKVSHYLRLLHTGLPIESQLLRVIENHLSAEVVLGTLATVTEAVEWLGQTYLYTRAMRSPNPLEYGITLAQRANDPDLYRWRETLITRVVRKLSSSGQLLYAPQTGTLRPTALGRVASHFYIDHATVEEFGDLHTGLKDYMEDADILALVGQASEFSNLKVRQEEFGEMDGLMKNHCRIDPKGGVEHVHGKVSVLLQAYLNGARIRDFALIIDQGYVVREAGRILRALFEIAFYCRAGSPDAPAYHGWVDTALSVLTICKALERRTWHMDPPLAQMLGHPSITPSVIALMQRPMTPSLAELRKMPLAQLSNILAAGGARSSKPADVAASLRMLPTVQITTSCQPIARVPDAAGGATPGTIVRINATVIADFEWSDKIHGKTEPWLFFVQDDQNSVLHYEQIVFFKGGLRHSFSFYVTLPPPPAPPAYFLYGNSERWLGSQAVCDLDFARTRVPAIQRPHTKLVGLEPFSTLAIRKAWPQVQVAQFDQFNPMQSQLVRPAYDSDNSLLIAAASGNGKTTVAELALLRHFSKGPKGSKLQGRPANSIVLFLTMHPATATAQATDWRRRMRRGLASHATNIVEFGPDLAKNLAAMSSAHIICSSADYWEATTRRPSNGDGALRRVGLLILQNLHLIGTGDAGAIMEVAVSRLRIHSDKQSCLRIVALSESVANADALAAWLAIAPGCVHSFKNGLRPRHLELILKGFSDRSVTTRLQAMAKPLYRFLSSAAADREASIVFVQSRRQAWQTAAEIVSHRVADGCDPTQFSGLLPHELQKINDRLDHDQIRQGVMHGVGIIHSGMRPSQRRLIELLFEKKKLAVLVATVEMGWLASPGVKASRVAVKGCEEFDMAAGRYMDYTHGQILQLVSRASTASDTCGKSTVMILCHDLKKEYLRGFLYHPYPVESQLESMLSSFLLTELVSGRVKDNSQAAARRMLQATLFGHRVRENPDYYDDSGGDSGEQMLQRAICELVDRSFATQGPDRLNPTLAGEMAARWALPTVCSISEALLVSGDESPVRVLDLLAAAGADCIRARYSDARFNAQLLRRLPARRSASLPPTWPLGQCKAKAWLILAATLEGIPLPSFEYVEDQRATVALVKHRLVPAMRAVLDAAPAGDGGNAIPTAGQSLRALSSRL